MPACRGLALLICRVAASTTRNLSSASLTRGVSVRRTRFEGITSHRNTYSLLVFLRTSTTGTEVSSVARARHLHLVSGAATRMSSGASSGGGNNENTETGTTEQEDYRERKAELRKHIKAQLKSMEQSAVDAGSAAVAERLLATPQLAQARAVSVYLSMPGELGTAAILGELFKQGKKVYIPKVLGPASADMRMFPLESEVEASSFPLTKWKIPEPPVDLVLSREDGVFTGDIDLVVVPAMAFDSRCNRLGHGRGYYDCFFERVNKSNAEKGRPPPVTMGVCFDEQVVDSVPTSASDVPLDVVMSPSRTFQRDKEGAT